MIKERFSLVSSWALLSYSLAWDEEERSVLALRLDTHPNEKKQTHPHAQGRLQVWSHDAL